MNVDICRITYDWMSPSTVLVDWIMKASVVEDMLDLKST